MTRWNSFVRMGMGSTDVVVHFVFGDDAALIRRRQPSSSTVQSFCFTFSHCIVRPPSYVLASPFATKPS